MNPLDRLTAFVRTYQQTRDAGGDFTALDEEASSLLSKQADPTLAALWAVATDNEADMVTDLAVRAGLLWRCQDETGSSRPCGYTNAATNDCCESCDTQRTHG